MTTLNASPEKIIKLYYSIPSHYLNRTQIAELFGKEAKSSSVTRIIDEIKDYARENKSKYPPKLYYFDDILKMQNTSISQIESDYQKLKALEIC